MSDSQERFLSRTSSQRNIFRCKPSCLSVSLVISLLITVTLVTVLIVGVIRKSCSSDTSLSTSGDPGTLCFACDHIKSGFEATERLYNVVKASGHTFCCLREENELSSTIIQMVIRRQGKRQLNEESTPNSHSSVFPVAGRHTIGAHLYLDVKSLAVHSNRRSTPPFQLWKGLERSFFAEFPAGNSGKNDLSKPFQSWKVGVFLLCPLSKGHAWPEDELSWRSEDGYFLSYNSGISLRSNRLRIPSPGRYLVYSHVTYKQTHKDNRDSFVHRITRNHPRQPNLGEVTLLYSRKSFAEYTLTGSSFLSAILVMRTDDELAVRVSDLSSVYEEPIFTYFGVFKL